MTSTFTKPSWNTKKKMAFTNARLIDPESNLDVMGGLLIEGNKIIDFGEGLFQNGVSENIESFDCKGHVLSPGLLDIQVHFREPGFENKETIETGSKSAAAGGITRVASMANTDPVIDNVAILDYIHARAKDSSYVHLHSYAAITQGLKGEKLTEMGLLKEHGAIGFSDDGLPIMDSLLMRRALEYASMLDVVVAQHAEDLSLSHACGSSMNEGYMATKLGLQAVPNAAEAIIVGRDLLLLELTGGHYHVLHISTKQAIDLVRAAKQKGLNVTCEAAPHHFCLTDAATEGYRTFAKMNPPLRSDEDRLAVIAGLQDGTIDVIATDHAPHGQGSKRVPFEQAAYGIVGLETMLPLSLGLFHDGILSLPDVLGKMTYKAADVIHTDAGRLKKGAMADLTLIDINHQWTIDTEAFSSKSKNAPFDSMEVKGCALATIVAGEIVYQR